MKDDALNPSDRSRLVSTVDRHVGNRIQHIRLSQHLSAAIVAKTLDVPEPAFARWEAGRDRVPPAFLLKLSKILSCPLSSFFEGLQETSHASDGSDFSDTDVTALLKTIPAARH